MKRREKNPFRLITHVQGSIRTAVCLPTKLKHSCCIISASTGLKKGTWRFQVGKQKKHASPTTTAKPICTK